MAADSGAEGVNPRLLATIRLLTGSISFLLAAGQLVRVLVTRDQVETPVLIAFAVWLTLSVLVAVGFHARVAAVTLSLLWIFLPGIDAVFYSHGTYLIMLMLFLAGVSDSERHYALRRRGRGEVGRSALYLMQCQISIVYLFAGLGKINEQFLSGDSLAYYFDLAVVPSPIPGWLLFDTHFLVPMSLGIVALEVFLAFAVWSKKLRPLVFGIVLPFHLVMLFAPRSVPELYRVILFGLTMYTLLMSFLSVRERGRLVVWDDSCTFCRRWIAAFGRLDFLGGLRFAGSSRPEAYDGTGVTPVAAAQALQLVEPDGRVRSGFSAVQGILAVLPLTFMIAPYMSLPGVRRVGDAAYRRVAARRTCTYLPPQPQESASLAFGAPEREPSGEILR